MIAFMPLIYEDELCFSWFARYYCHSGYPAYYHALNDFFGKKIGHFNAEFISSSFSKDARKIVEDIIPMDKLILNHTMFPIVRFMEHKRMQIAMESMIRQEGRVGNILPLPKYKRLRFLKYCPCCAAEQREKNGEAYWTRTANINGLDVCAKHRCRLKNTDIALSGRMSSRLHIAEYIIEDTEPEFINDGLELQFARYLTNVFQAPIDLNNSIPISDFLISRLDGTQYLSVSGIQRNISLLFNDFRKFFKDLPDKGIKDLPQMQKVFADYRVGLYEVCQIAFFLGIDAGDLVAPTLPAKSQEELFKEKVEELKAEGMSAIQIGKMLGTNHHTVQNAVRNKVKAEHDYSGRKGITKTDWSKLDEETLPLVRDICLKLYNGEDGTPKRITVATIERMLNMPGKRLDYLPKCKKEVKKYEETQEVCWARKIVWQYRKMVEEGQNISYSRLCKPLHLKKSNFIRAFPFLEKFCKNGEEEKIRGLV